MIPSIAENLSAFLPDLALAFDLASDLAFDLAFDLTSDLALAFDLSLDNLIDGRIASETGREGLSVCLPREPQCVDGQKLANHVPMWPDGPHGLRLPSCSRNAC